ncbi:hypothetical protein ACFXAF_00185 [Kitasatospora sp. NPDC059463]
MIGPRDDALAIDAFLDALEDPAFDARHLFAVEELFDIDMADLEWMLP